MRLLLCNRGGQPEEEIRLVVMAGESIYANVRLRLAANRTYGPIVRQGADFGLPSW